MGNFFCNPDRKIIIHKICIDTIPCQHYVSVNNKKTFILMNGSSIYKLYKNENNIPKHFRPYKDSLNNL